MSQDPGRAERVAAVLLASGRAVAGLVPRRLRKVVENRFFYAVFNLTRVTNDAYGWRPDPDSAPPGPPDPAAPAKASEPS